MGSKWNLIFLLFLLLISHIARCLRHWCRFKKFVELFSCGMLLNSFHLTHSFVYFGKEKNCRYCWNSLTVLSSKKNKLLALEEQLKKFQKFKSRSFNWNWGKFKFSFYLSTGKGWFLTVHSKCGEWCEQLNVEQNHEWELINNANQQLTANMCVLQLCMWFFFQLSISLMNSFFGSKKKIKMRVKKLYATDKIFA